MTSHLAPQHGSPESHVSIFQSKLLQAGRFSLLGAIFRGTLKLLELD